MCLGIPGLVVEVLEPTAELPAAIVEFAGIRRKVCVACVPESQPGDYVIVHAGIAISLVDADEAARLLEMLDQINDDEGWRDPENEQEGTP